MIRLGTLLTFFGVGSALLHFTSVQFRLLMWSEPMQPALGFALGGVGVALILVKLVLNKKSEQKQPGGYGPPPAGYPAPHYGQPQQFAQPQQFGQPAQFPPPPGQYGPEPQGPQPVGAPPQQFGPQGFQQPNPFERPRG